MSASMASSTDPEVVVGVVVPAELLHDRAGGEAQSTGWTPR
jgi:hypothetical protein